MRNIYIVTKLYFFNIAIAIMYKTIKSDNFTWSNREKTNIGKINNLITFQEDATEKKAGGKNMCGEKANHKKAKFKKACRKQAYSIENAQVSKTISISTIQFGVLLQNGVIIYIYTEI